MKLYLNIISYFLMLKITIIVEVFAWGKNDYVVMDVKDFKSYTAENLFVVGGGA